MLRKRASSVRVARRCRANKKVFAVLLCPGYVRSENKLWEKRVITAFLYIEILFGGGFFTAPCRPIVRSYRWLVKTFEAAVMMIGGERSERAVSKRQ